MSKKNDSRPDLLVRAVVVSASLHDVVTNIEGEVADFKDLATLRNHLYSMDENRESDILSDLFTTLPKILDTKQYKTFREFACQVVEDHYQKTQQRLKDFCGEVVSLINEKHNDAKD